MAFYAYTYETAGHLQVWGEDAASFLQSQFSNDLRPFADGHCRYGLWLDARGRIVADSWVLCEGPERFRIISERSGGARIEAQLRHHIVADEVEIELAPPLPCLALIGGEGESHGALGPGLVARFAGQRAHLPSQEWVFADEDARKVLMEEIEHERVFENWIHLKRMEAGISQLYFEAQPGDMPEECGLMENGVSLNKGCFLGQEVVARMHHVGRPQRGLYLLCGSGEPPEVSSPVSHPEGKLLGELRTAVRSSSGWTGVALLKSRFVEAGMDLTLDGRAVQVVGLYGLNQGI